MISTYYFEEIIEENSIFLAGPTPRDSTVESWRDSALLYLKKFSGTVYIPEFRTKERREYDKSEIIEWEEKALEKARIILFWIPRSKTLPGFTTNIEYGFYRDSKKIIVGFPDETEKIDYIFHYVKKNKTPFSNNLEELCKLALKIKG